MFKQKGSQCFTLCPVLCVCFRDFLCIIICICNALLNIKPLHFTGHWFLLPTRSHSPLGMLSEISASIIFKSRDHPLYAQEKNFNSHFCISKGNQRTSMWHVLLKIPDVVRNMKRPRIMERVAFIHTIIHL